MLMTDPRTLLAELYWAAVEAAAPGPALRAALDRDPPERQDRRVWILAVGKAAPAMAEAAVEALARRGRRPSGGIIIAPSAVEPPHPALTTAVGNHPLPGPGSFAAGKALGDVVARVRPEDEAWVLLSGGATSLAAAPHGAIKPDELLTLYTLLLSSGLDIAAMNTVRKRFSRWGAGRLALALHPARVRNFVVSDVIGDDLSAIGSGPCVPDETTASAVHTLLTEAGVWDRIPLSMRRYVLSVERDPTLETPKPGHPAFRNVEKRVIASNRLALDAAAARAAALGISAKVLHHALDGEAAAVGRRLATTLLSYQEPRAPQQAARSHMTCLIWGGETVVKIDAPTSGVGGRCQELALAAARELASAPPSAPRATILAAGTDGRDGPTDAAGAIVDNGTWDAIRRVGRDPERDLAEHNAYMALDAAGALLRTGLTGTNVMDIVIGLRESARGDGGEGDHPSGGDLPVAPVDRVL